MKKIFIGLFVMLINISGANADDCFANNEATLRDHAQDVSCDRILISNDIEITNSPVFVYINGVEIRGSDSAYTLYGNMNAPLLSIKTSNVEIHDVSFQNESTGQWSISVFVSDGVDNNEVYDVEFHDCQSACVYVYGNGKARLEHNYYYDTDYNEVIVYDSGQTHKPPKLSEPRLISYDEWQFDFVTPSLYMGDIELYYQSGDDIVPFFSVLIEDVKTFYDFIFTMPVTNVLPKYTFHAFFISNGETSEASEPFVADWDDASFSWGDLEACNVAWFKDAFQGQVDGDFDDDGLRNGDEDANHNCIVDEGETDPAVANLHDDEGDDEVVDKPGSPGGPVDDGDGEETTVVGNEPPSAPLLLFPEDGMSVYAAEVDFKWEPSVDPDGDDIMYRIYICELEDFTDCEPQIVGDIVIGAEMHVGNHPYAPAVLILGLVGMGGLMPRRWKLLLVIAVVAMGIFSMGCGSSGDSDEEVGFSISNLAPGHYYWKVTASDGQGNVVDSEVWEFTVVES